MLDMFIGLAVWLIFDACFYVLGALAVIHEMRRSDGDLFAEWMDRREARKEARE